MQSLLIAPWSLILTNVDAAFEICTILDKNALRNDIARKHSGLPQLDTVFTVDIAVDSTVNHNFLGSDVRADASIWTNGEVVIVQLNAAFYLSVNVQVFTAGKFALHHDGFANMGYIGTTLLAGSKRVHGTDLLISLAGLRRRPKHRTSISGRKINAQYAQRDDPALRSRDLKATGAAQFGANYTEQTLRTQRIAGSSLKPIRSRAAL